MGLSQLHGLRDEIGSHLGPVPFPTSGWEKGLGQFLNLSADNNHRNSTFPTWKSRHTTGTHHLRKHFIWQPGPAVAEVRYNLQLTVCTSLWAWVKWAVSKAQSHASLGPDREMVLLVSLRLIFSSHYLIFFLSLAPLYSSLTLSFSLSPTRLRSIQITLL